MVSKVGGAKSHSYSFIRRFQVLNDQNEEMLATASDDMETGQLEKIDWTLDWTID